MAQAVYTPGDNLTRGDSSQRTLRDNGIGALTPNVKRPPKPDGAPARYSRRQAPEQPMITAAEVHKRYRECLRYQSGSINEYWMNTAFLAGQQWLWYNPQTSRIDQLPRDPERVQVTINQLRPASRTIMSKLVSRELRFEVMPDAADDATLRGAAIAEAVVQCVHDEDDWETKREDVLWSTWKGGTGIIAVEWDPAAGDDLGADPETGKRVGTGDITTSTHSVSEFGVEPGTRHSETARYWLRSIALPPAQVQAMFDLAELPKADASAYPIPGQQKGKATGSGGSGSIVQQLTMVISYFERPNWLSPKGYVCTVVGDQIVEGPVDWPFPWTEHLNFAVMRETQVDGRWDGETVLTTARPVQVAFNASWSSIIEHVKLAGNARLAIPSSSADLLDQLTDLPGELIVYPDGTEKPGYIGAPQMPDWWVEQPDKLKNEIDDIIGVHEISRGGAPSGVESGYGLTILAEQDATPLGRMTKEQSIAWGKVATMVLELYAVKVKETRTALIKAEGQPVESVKWTGKDLMGQTKARIPLDAIIPYSRAAMQMFAEKAMQMGLIKTPDQYAKLAQVPNQRDILEVAHPDVAKARRENFIMAQDEIAIPAAFDDHAAHVTEHNNFRKSNRYEMLSENAKLVFELHIKGHEVMSAEELGEQYDKSQQNPLLAAAASGKGAPSLSPQEAADAEQKLRQEPGTALTSPGGAMGPSGQPTPGTPQPGAGPEAPPTAPAGAIQGPPQLGPPTAGFPEGIPLPQPGGNF